MTTIAGHTFSDTPAGRRCITITSSGVPCMRAWLDIRDADDCDLDQRGIAHAGALNQEELSQIRAERQRERDAIWDAVTNVGGRSTRAD